MPQIDLHQESGLANQPSSKGQHPFQSEAQPRSSSEPTIYIKSRDWVSRSNQKLVNLNKETFVITV